MPQGKKQGEGLKEGLKDRFPGKELREGMKGWLQGQEARVAKDQLRGQDSEVRGQKTSFGDRRQRRGLKTISCSITC